MPARRATTARKARPARRRSSTRRTFSYSLSFFLRRSSAFTPKRLADSFLRIRSSYSTNGGTNPHRYHWAVDAPCPKNTIIQLPAKARLIAKGYDKAAGYWMEWEFLEGPWIHRFGRWFHMNRACGHPLRTVKPRKYSVGRSGNTGSSTAPHVHFELARYRWALARDPRWNPTEAMNNAIAAKDY